VCQGVTTIVYGLAKEYGDGVQVDIENATTPENREKIQTEFGFKTHGLVIYDKDGEVKETLDGHDLQEPQIRLALQNVINGEREDLPSAGPE